MGLIPQTFNNLPIGRQITRTVGTITETGVVHGLQRSSSPGWLSIYSVNWTRPDKQEFMEELALSTIQSYYSDSDLYMDEPYVVDEIRLLQKYDWDVKKCPEKDTAAWEKAVREKLHGNSHTSKALAKEPKARKTSGAQGLPSAAAKNAAKASSADMGKPHQSKKQKTLNESPGGITLSVRKLTADVMRAVNKTGDKVKEAPQVLGQAISDALPSSSKKISNSKPSASTGTTGTAQPLTGAAQKAQEAIQAMSPARGSGTGSRAASNKKQETPSARRASARHLPQTVTIGDTDQSISIDGDKDCSRLALNLQQIASSLSAAPSSQAQTSEQGPSFRATGLQGLSHDDGAVSPQHTSPAGPEEEEESMVELPVGSNPSCIPMSLAFKEKDVLVKDYSAEGYDAEGEYEVDYIVAERPEGKKSKKKPKMEYLVKWKGYELDPSAWTPRENLEQVQALTLWLNRNKSASTSKSPSKGSKQAGKRKSGQH